MKPFLVVFLLCVTLATYSLGKPTVSDSKKAQGDKLSDAQHYTEGGKHDHTYDHEAFLGKERADQFKELTPEESRRRLGIIVDKIDSDKDGKITTDEMTYWIKHSLKKYAYDDAEGRMELQDRDKSGDLEFEEWINTTYSYMADEDRQDELYDKTRKISFREQIGFDKKSWEMADVNKNGRLDSDEYATFLHPHDFPHMAEAVINRHMRYMDKNRDGYVSKSEYLDDLYNPERDGPDEPSWLQDERENFDSGRDLDGDGRLSRDEVKHWVLPTHYDPYEAEAQHLVSEADNNKDEVLTKEEILQHQDSFVGSRIAEFSKQLKNVHDEF
jgi:Ca2+-binding EF-hand superfamily protein